MCGGDSGPHYTTKTEKECLGLNIVLCKRYRYRDNVCERLEKEYVKDELLKKLRIFGYPYVRDITDADLDVSKLNLRQSSPCYKSAIKILDDRRNTMMKKEREDVLSFIRIWHEQCYVPKKQSYFGLLCLDITYTIYIHLMISYGFKYETNRFKELYDGDFNKIRLPLFFQQSSVTNMAQPILVSSVDIKTRKLSDFFNYVIMANGELIIGQKNEMRSSHLELSRGYPVLAAGEVQFKNGKLESYNLKSDNYRCDDAAKKKVELAFKKEGFKAKKKYLESVSAQRPSEFPISMRK